MQKAKQLSSAKTSGLTFSPVCGSVDEFIVITTLRETPPTAYVAVVVPALKAVNV